MKKIAELKVNGYTEREAVVMALSENGYFVTVEVRKPFPYSLLTDYYVIVFELE